MAREAADPRSVHLSLLRELDPAALPPHGTDRDPRPDAPPALPPTLIDIGAATPSAAAAGLAEPGRDATGLAARWAWLMRHAATSQADPIDVGAGGGFEGELSDSDPAATTPSLVPLAPATAVDPDPAAFPTTHKTTAEAGQQITRHNYEWGTSLGQAAGPISFGFRVSGATYPVTGHNISNFSPLTAAQQTAARTALRFWSDLAGITFTDFGNTNNATILFQNYRDPTDGSGAFAFLPSPSGTASSNAAGDVFINTAFGSTTAVGPGTYEWLTFLHEIGHTVGLEHPGNYNAAPNTTLTYAANAEYIEDTNQYTVMSYFDETNTGAAYFNTSPETPMLDDVAAIQRLYGPNNRTRTGDDRYGFNSNLVGSVYAIAAASQPVVFAVWDSGGNDTFDFSLYAQNQVIDLNPEHFSSLGGLTFNVAVATGVTIENAVGGSGNDLIIPNGSLIGTLTGGAGNDTFRGTQGGLNLYTIADIGVGDKINFTDAALAGFSFTFDGTTLNYGASLHLTMSNHPGGTFVASSDPVGGIDLSFALQLILVDAGNFDSGGKADLAFGNGGGVAIWINQSSGFAQVAVPNASMGAEWKATNTGDFNSDGSTDILWTRAVGDTAIWLMNGTALRQVGSPAGSMGAEWHVAGVGDFGGDRKADIAWGNNSGQAAIWSMDGVTLGGFGVANGRMGAEWGISIVGDLSGDQRQDLLWVSNAGDVTDWLMNGSNLVGLNDVGHMGLAWHAAGAGDITGDGVADVVWVDTANNVQIWAMNSGRIGQFIFPAGHNGLEWHFKEVADFTGNGRADLLWLTDAGAAQIWSLNGTAVAVLAMATPSVVLAAAEDGAPAPSAAAADQAAAKTTTGFDDIAAPQAGWTGDDAAASGVPAGGDIALPSDGGGEFAAIALDETWLGGAVPDPNWGAA